MGDDKDRKVFQEWNNWLSDERRITSVGCISVCMISEMSRVRLGVLGVYEVRAALLCK